MPVQTRATVRVRAEHIAGSGTTTYVWVFAINATSMAQSVGGYSRARQAWRAWDRFVSRVVFSDGYLEVGRGEAYPTRARAIARGRAGRDRTAVTKEFDDATQAVAEHHTPPSNGGTIGEKPARKKAR